MRRTIWIPLVVLLAALGLVGFILLSSPQSRGPAYRLATLPTPRLIAPIRTPTPAADSFLEYFPEIGTPTPGEGAATSPTPQPEALGPTAPPTKPSPSESRAGETSLVSVLLDWHYVNYTLIASKKRGTLENFRTQERREVWEGMKFDQGVVVASLSPQAAVMQLGGATFALRLAPRPAFFDKLAERHGPLTPDEQRQGLEYYMAVYGDKMREIAKNYKPLPGEKLPTSAPSQEEIQKKKKQYMDVYGRQFKQEQALRPKTPPSSAAQQQFYFQQYWRTYHPDKPMPTFPIRPEGSPLRAPIQKLTESPIQAAQ